MASIKREISSRKNGDGKAEIILRFTLGRGSQWRLHSGLFINPLRFKDGKIVRPRADQEEAAELTALEAKIQKAEMYLYDIALTDTASSMDREALEDGITKALTPPKQKEEKKPKAKKGEFFELLSEFIHKRQISDWRKQRYWVLYRALQRFEAYRQIRRRKSYRLSINEFTSDDIEDFELFYRSEPTIFDKYPEIFDKFPADTRKAHKTRRPAEKGDNTVINLFACFRSFFKDLYERGLIQNNPFSRYHGKTVEQYGTPYYITLEERNIIADFDFSDDPADELQRDIFIFQTLIGCRVSDLYRFTQSNIVNDALEYIANKTRNTRSTVIRVPLTQRAKELIAKYKGKDNLGRLFPFISQQKYNVAIKRIFKKCGITRVVTVLNATTGKEEQRHINEIASSHLARRTFVGNLYKKVKDPNLVGALSGHKEGSRAFARYRTIDDDLKREMMGYLE